MTTVSLGSIIAFDENGDDFIKEVVLYQDNGKLILDFGNFAIYNLSDLQNSPLMQAPDNKKFFLDLMGRNHKGSPVYILTSQLRSLVGVAQVVAAVKFAKPAETQHEATPEKPGPPRCDYCGTNHYGYQDHHLA